MQTVLQLSKHALSELAAMQSAFYQESKEESLSCVERYKRCFPPRPSALNFFFFFSFFFLAQDTALSQLTLGRTRKFIPPPWYKGGGAMVTHPGVFDMLHYFETILPLVESL